MLDSPVFPLDALLGPAPAPLLVFNEAREIIFVNDTALRLFGLERNEVVGKPCNEINVTIIDQDGEPLPPQQHPLHNALCDNIRVDHLSVSFIRPTGEPMWMEAWTAPLLHHTASPLTIAYFKDVTRRKIIERELARKTKLLEELTSRDPLTGLWNHNASIERLGCEIARVQRYGGNLSVALMDIDHFKRINDRFGHRLGDEVLSRATSIMLEQLREIDTCGRYGGEEFIIVLPNTTLSNAASVADRLRRELHTLSFTGVDLIITASAGVVEWKDETPEGLIKRADLKLLMAKDLGRDRVES